MKKLVLSLLMAAGLLASNTKLNAQALSQGNVTIDAYYGVASVFGKAFFDALGSGDDASSKFIGPIGGKFEYMASEKIGVGFEYNMTIGEASWTNTGIDSTTSQPYSYNYKVTRNLHRFMPRLNVHFGGSESFDAYFGVSAGYRLAKWSWETNDSTYEPDQGASSFALRISLGGRYYFTDNIGLLMEFGLGGGTLLHFGVSAKF